MYISSSLPVLELSKLSPRKVDEAAAKYPLTKSRMAELATFFEPLAVGHNLKFRGGDEDSDDQLHRLIAGRFYGTTAVMRQIFFSLMLGEGNLQKAYEAMPRTVIAALKLGLANRFVQPSQIKAIIEAKPERRRSLSGTTTYVSMDYIESFFTRPNRSAMSLSKLLVDHLSPLMGITKEKAGIKTYDKPDSNLTIANYQPGIKDKLDYIRQFQHENGLFPSAGINIFSVADINLVCSGCAVEEPFAQPKLRSLRTMRTRMLLFLMTNRMIYRRRNETIDSPAQIREFFLAYPTPSYAQYINTVVPYLQRLSKSLLCSQLTSAVLHVILDPLKTIYAGDNSQWVDVDAYVKYIAEICRDKGISFIDENNLAYFSVKDSFTGVEITLTNIDRLIIPAVISGTLMLLASVGGLEIAYDINRTGLQYPLECIRACRLTDNGRYFLGLTDEFKDIKPTATSENAAIALDPDNLIILINNAAVVNTIKSTFGSKISANRYISSPEILCDKAHSASVLQHNKTLLKNLALVSELPPIWEDLFASAKQRMEAIQQERIFEYTLYRVDTNDTDLIDILTTDGEIKPLIRLVEGGAFLIKKSDLPKLQSLLSVHGYRLPMNYF